MSVIICKKTLYKILIFSLVLVITLTIFPISGAYNVFYNYNFRKLPIYGVSTTEKKLSISFDCAWGDEYTNGLLEVMEERNVRCTFFAVEFWTKKYKEHIKTIVEKGHEIGTHSATHPYMSKLNKSQIEKELKSSINAIEEITSKKVTLFRPPYGDYNNTLIETAESLNLFTIQWSVDSLDWKNLSKTEIVNRVLKSAKSGSIVLFHNNGLHTLEALPVILDALIGQGYTFVPISELIYKENYKIDVNGTQIKNN